MKSFNALKVTSLLVSLALSGAAIHAQAADTAAVETYNNSNWQTPLAAEFDKIDTSGNGLILLNEAAKAKAFNAKSFAQADVDHSGSIDQREFIRYRTGAWPAETPVNLVNAASADSMAVPLTKEIETEGDVQQYSEADEVILSDSTSQPTSTTDNRTARNVLDDTIITTKAKAAILAAEDLKSLQISVDTRNGEVTLSGSVDNESARVKAQELVAKIEGVQLVRNGLQVKK